MLETGSSTGPVACTQRVPSHFMVILSSECHDSAEPSLRASQRTETHLNARAGGGGAAFRAFQAAIIDI